MYPAQSGVYALRMQISKHRSAEPHPLSNRYLVSGLCLHAMHTALQIVRC